MRHKVAGRKLDRSGSHRRALYRNLVTDLLGYEKITTTEAKAKELRRFVDKMVTLSKRDTLHARRMAFSFLRNKKATQKLFSDIAKRFQDRVSGYTRIYKYKTRRGDGAPLALIEFVKEEK